MITFEEALEEFKQSYAIVSRCCVDAPDELFDQLCEELEASEKDDE